MSTRNNDAIPRLRVKRGEELKAIHAKARRAFTAADLQRYTEFEEGIPADKVLAELRKLDQQPRRKRKKA